MLFIMIMIIIFIIIIIIVIIIIDPYSTRNITKHRITTCDQGYSVA